MTFNDTCLIVAGSQGRANWADRLANLRDSLLARLMFDIAFAVRFAELPYGAKPARSKPEDIMVAKEILQGDPRTKASKFVESISKIAKDRDEAAFDVLF